LKYDGTAIGYDFSFNISVTDMADAGLSFAKPFSWGGAAGIGFKALGSLRRENRRSFILVDTFSDLLINVKDSYCENIAAGFGVAYPITGSIGMDEIIGTFFSLNESAKLENKDKVPFLQDTVIFQTKLMLSATPSLTLLHAGLGWQAASASVAFSEERIDEHQVVIGISLPLEAKPNPPVPAPKQIPSKAAPQTRAADRVLNELQNQRDISAFSRSILKRSGGSDSAR
jgi:hypothetical protein